MGVSQNWRYLFGGPHNKDYSILGSILGFPYFGKTTRFMYITLCLGVYSCIGGAGRGGAHSESFSQFRLQARVYIKQGFFVVSCFGGKIVVFVVFLFRGMPLTGGYRRRFLF